MDSNLHSPDPRLIELHVAHADLDALIDSVSQAMPLDVQMMQRLKNRRLPMRDGIVRIERLLSPDEQA